MSRTITYRCTLTDDPPGCAIPVPFDPKEIFGKVRAPVVVSLNGYSYRSTIAAMGGPYFIPLRKSNREAAGVQPGEAVEVTLTLDQQARTVTPPDDLLAALKTNEGARAAWDRLSYTHQREHVEAIEDARKPETRQRRIAKAVAMALEKAGA